MKSFKTYVASVLGIATLISAVIFIGGVNEKGIPDPITVDGQTIEFTWTDENVGEDLIIYTDRATYDQGFSHATVYVAVTNQTGKDQNVELSGYFKDNKRHIADVSVLTTVTYPIYTPVYSEQCHDELASSTIKGKQTFATSTVCLDVQTGTTTEEKTENRWIPLPKVSRDPSESLKEAQLISQYQISKKSVNNYISTDKSLGYAVPNGGTVYYKLNTQFVGNVDDNFFLEAIGSEGGYGHLDPWFNPSWQYRFKVEVVPTKVGSAGVTAFPVYFDLAGAPTAFWSNVQGDGDDIRVVESDETTETALELVWFATTTKRGELHFKADSLATTSTSTFYIYYGNPSASAYAVTDTYGRNNVWTDFLAVFHMQSGPTDSTGSHTGSTVGSVSYGSSFGLVGGGSDTPGTGSDYVSTGASYASGNTAKSFSLWMNPDNVADRAWAIAGGTDVNDAAYGLFYGDSSGVAIFHGNGGSADYTYAGSISNNTWYQFGASYDGVNLNSFYKNGASNGTKTRALSTGASTVRLHLRQNAETTSRMDGSLDEVRIKNGQMSSSYYTTEYNNITSTSTFFYVGSEEAKPADTVIQGGIIWFD